MNASTSLSISRRRRTYRPSNVEVLESRTLLSTWATVDAFHLASNSLRTRALGMAADSAGNVYSAGVGADSNQVWHGLIREQTTVGGVTSWSTVEDLPNALFQSVVVDSAGDTFASGWTNPDPSSGSTWTGASSWIIAERRAGQSAFTIVTDPTIGGANGIALDSSGNVYTVGQAHVAHKSGHSTTYTNDWMVRKETVANLLLGKSLFTTVDDLASADAHGVTYIPGGSAVGLYVVGQNNSNGYWTVRKSTNGGSTWSTVDNFSYQSTNGGLAWGALADPSGNIFVVGQGNTNSGSTSLYTRWLVRESSNGGTTWSTVDDYDLGPAGTSAEARGVGTDSSGNTYVIGTSGDGTSTNVTSNHSIIRSNIGGSWHTVDDYAPAPNTFDNNYGGAYGYSLTRDSFGNLYAGIGATGPSAIRSLPSAPSNLTATADSINPTSQIDLSWTNSAGGNESGFAIYRSTDGINFSLVNSVGASTTTYTDTGLSAGTIYYYYVTAVLNSVDGTANGASAPSNTASATTQSGGMAAPAAAAAVFSSTQISSTTDPTDIFHHRKHRLV